ncbi:MAG: transposase, partial [Pseudomonadota bacterium]
MQSKTYSEQQIIRILKEGDEGQQPITELCRSHGINPKTYYRWKKKYSGVDDVNTLKELKKLREENNRLKKVIA